MGSGKQPVTAIIDIGKTNKKFFLFDDDYNEVFCQYDRFPETTDDDGFPCEDLNLLIRWVQQCIKNTLADARYQLTALNFSTYGASLVHVDKEGKQVVPFYNYLKPLDNAVIDVFLTAHNIDRKTFSSVTSSPLMGFLNSGIQLFYLKHYKPELFKKINYSLHFPQYLSSLFTKRILSDYTSIGCHTVLWDFQRSAYHEWLAHENLEKLLPPVSSCSEITSVIMEGNPVDVGIGVHDSSSALLPYIQASTDQFVLISTGTWSICMNSDNSVPITTDDLEKDCLSFLSTTGSSIKASRLFLGKHISNQAKILAEFFNVEYSTYKTVKYNPAFTSKRIEKKALLFDHSVLKPERFGLKNNSTPSLDIFDNYEDAYHHLLDEITDLQIASLQLVIGSTDVKTIYVDGGFSDNEVFMQQLANKLPTLKVYASSFAKGTALGAALLVNQDTLSSNYLKQNYSLRQFKPVREGVQ